MFLQNPWALLQHNGQFTGTGGFDSGDRRNNPIRYKFQDAAASPGPPQEPNPHYHNQIFLRQSDYAELHHPLTN